MGLSTVFYRAPAKGAETTADSPTTTPFIPALGRTLTLRAHYDALTGYGQLACGILSHLKARGVRVQAQEMRSDGKPWEPEWGDAARIPGGLRHLFVERNTEGWELLLGPPKHDAHTKHTLRFTMWEANRLPPDSVPLLNVCKAVILPSEWGLLAADAAGVNVPLHKVNLPVSDCFHQPCGLPQKGPFTFGLMCRRHHGGVRKGVAEAAECFLKAFPDNPDVRFHLKVYPDDEVGDVPKDPRIKVLQAAYTEEQMASWFASLHCYVSMSHAEGFGLGQVQALAMGRPVIGCVAHAQAEYLTPETAYPVAYDLERAEVVNSIQGYYSGIVWVPKKDSVIAAMREAYANRGLLEQKAKAAAVMGAKFNWARFTDELLAVAKKEGYPV